MNIFNAHGSLRVNVEGPLLILEGTGPWNLESLLDSGKIAGPQLAKLAGKPWGVIATLYGEPIYVPEAADMLSEIVRQNKLDGRVASALLVDKSYSPQFARNHIGEIYRNAGETFEFFSDLQLAKQWVLGKVAEASLSDIIPAKVSDSRTHGPRV